jgi:TetR/AcrR family tetracycline transcriptional repressor
MFNERCSIVKIEGLRHKDRMKISRDEIVACGLALVDEKGMAALNMRAIAARLGVQASALYWHFKSKNALMRAMAGSFYRRALEAAAVEKGWREWLTCYGRALRRALLDHQGSAQLCAIARPSPGSAAEAADALAAPLIAMGLSKHQALSCIASVNALALGWAVYEQSEALHDYLAEMIGFDESFATGLNAMVSGFTGG